MSRPLALLIGCGRVGHLVAARLRFLGWQSIGVRRRWSSGAATNGLLGPDWRLQGDAANPEVVQRLRRWCGNRSPSVVFVTATPGLRRQTSNGIDDAVRQLSNAFPNSAFILVGSTGVYADLFGRTGDESAALTNQGRAGDLRAIETAVLAHGAPAVVFRAGGLYGGQRHLRLARMAQEPLVISGPLHRFLPVLHEDDLAATLVLGAQRLLAGQAVPQLINLVEPTPTRARQFFTHAARKLQVPLQVRLRSGVVAPSRHLMTRYPEQVCICHSLATQ